MIPDNCHRCSLGHPTRYQSFSGGREYYCPICGEDGIYPDEGDNLPWATLLRTADGRELLRSMMRDEIARRKEEKFK